MPMPLKIFLPVAAFLFSLQTFGQSYVHDPKQDTACKGVVHGVVVGQDRKPWSGIGLILEPVGDYDYVLPSTKTDQHGEYRFEQVCAGKWSVFVEDEKAGYPDAGRLENRFLYGHWSPQVEITSKKLDAQLNVDVPPKPGELQLHVTSTRAKMTITNLEIKLTVTRRRWMQSSCSQQQSYTCEDYPVLVPPDQDVKLRVTSKGFRERKESKGRGKRIHLSAGQKMTINVEFWTRSRTDLPSSSPGNGSTGRQLCT